jgi:hypothetical protein
MSEAIASGKAVHMGEFIALRFSGRSSQSVPTVPLRSIDKTSEEKLIPASSCVGRAIMA